MGHKRINKEQDNLLLKTEITYVTITTDNKDTQNKNRAEIEKKYFWIGYRIKIKREKEFLLWSKKKLGGWMN